MTDDANGGDDAVLEFTHDFDAYPEKVWRAISLAEYRERWLPLSAGARLEPVSIVPGVALTFKIIEEGPPEIESLVTFELRPGASGGTTLRIVHRLPKVQSESLGLSAANENAPVMLLAA